jgi:hypothetical protein
MKDAFAVPLDVEYPRKSGRGADPNQANKDLITNTVLPAGKSHLRFVISEIQITTQIT